MADRFSGIFDRPDVAAPSRTDGVHDKYKDIFARHDAERAQINVQADTNPEVAARANRYARETGVPAQVAQDEIGNYDAQARQRRVAQVAEAHPQVARFMADPRNAAVAHDDTAVMARISQTFKDFWQPPIVVQGRKRSWMQSHFVDGFMGAVDKAHDAVLGIADAVDSALMARSITKQDIKDVAAAAPQVAADVATGSPRALGKGLADTEGGIVGLLRAPVENWVGTDNAAARYLANRHAQWDALSKSLEPTTKNRVARDLLNGVSSLPISGAALGFTAAGMPQVGLGLLSAITGGQSYNTARDAGLDPFAAFQYGARDAIVEAGTEALPLFRFAKNTQIGSTFGKRLLENMVEEQGGEQIATALQDLNQWYAIDSNKGKTFGDYLAERPSAALSTALATAISVGASNVGVNIGEKLVQRADRVFAARADAEALGGIMDDASKSALRARDRDTFQQFVAQVAENHPAEHVYLPVEAVDTYMQSEDFQDEDGFFEGLRPQLDEARATGGDIVAPVAEVAAKLAGTKAWEALKDDARLSGGGHSLRESVREAEDVREKITTRGADILAAHEAETKTNAPLQEVLDEVKGQLEAIGFTPAAAIAQARLIAANRAAWGEHLGMTAAEYHKLRPLDIQRVVAGQTIAASPAGATVMDQSDTATINVGLNVGDTRGLNEQDVVAALADEGVTITQSAEHPSRSEPTLVARLSRPLTPEEAHRVSVKLRQEAIGQIVGSQGALHGPEAANWGSFDPAEFLDMEGRYLAARTEAQTANVAPLLDLPATSPGPFQPARIAAANYMAKAELPYSPPTTFGKLDVKRAARIAAAYDEMVDDPTNPAVKAAYDALVRETLAQWDEIKLTGLQVEFIDGEDPYGGDPRGAVNDVRENNHLWVFNTEDGYGQGEFPADTSSNPMLAIVPGETWSGKLVRVNDVFRVVHDYFGHVKEGTGFRARGEENAWRVHSSMYTPLARAAMTTETRGQNSWLNYGPHGEHNRKAKIGETIFAPQKLGLLPDWAIQDGATDADAEMLLTTERAAWTTQRIEALLADVVKEPNTAGYVVMMSPDTFLGLTASATGREALAANAPPLDATKLVEAGPIMLSVNQEGEPSEWQKKNGTTELRSSVMGHDGRHRMTMLKAAGITEVPVFLRLSKANSRETPTAVTRIALNPQRSRLDTKNNGDTPAELTDMILLTRASKPRIVELQSGATVLFQRDPEMSYAEARSAETEQIKNTSATLGGAHIDAPYMVATETRDGKETLYAPGSIGDRPFVVQSELFEGTDFGIDPNIARGTVDVDGVERSVVNADGALIARSREHIRNFWRWFGESEAVDDEGRPIVFYHGPKARFSEFDPGMTIGGNFFFSDARPVADTYTGAEAQTLPVYLRVFDPVRYDAEGRGWDDVVWEQHSYEEIAKAEERYVDDVMSGYTPTPGMVGEATVSENGKDRDVYFVDHPNADPSDYYDTFDEAHAALVEARVEEEAAARERAIEDVDEVTLVEHGYLPPYNKSTDDLAALAKDDRADSVWIDDVVDTDDGSDHSSTVVIILGDPFKIKSATGNNGDFDPAKADILFQNDGKARGQIAIYPDRSVITLFENANLSTFLHETGHLFLHEFSLNVQHPNASAAIKADWAKIEKWFASKGAPVVNGVIPREAHELWARSFERYALEGKAPSAALQSSFALFKGWLLKIYEVVQNLRAPITPEIRDVMARLLATQQQIDEYSDEQNAKALFTDAAQAGMTEAEFNAYEASVAGARNDAYDALLFRTMHQIRQQRKAVYTEQAKAIRNRITTGVDAEPRFRALRLLRTGKIDDQELPVRLDLAWAKERYGDDILDRLPANIRYSATEGSNIDDIADLVGAPSGAELMTALLDIGAQTRAMRESGDKRQLRDKMIDDASKNAVNEEGIEDPLTDGSIEEEAIAAINNERQGEVIASESRALARRTGGTATPYRLAREWAKRKIEAGMVNDVVSRSAMQRYARAAAKAAREAEAAMLKGDIDATFRHKQAQLLNHALLVEAKAAADEIDRIVARMKKLADRAAMKSVDQDYFDKVHLHLENYNFRPRSQTFLTEMANWAKWAEGRVAEGYEVHTPERLNEDGLHYSRTTVEDLFGLADTVDSLMALGRHKQKLLDGRAEREFTDVRSRILANLRKLKARILPKTSLEDDTLRRKLRSSIAGGLKVSTIALDMDHQDQHGPMMNLLVHRAGDRSQLATRLRAEVLTPIANSLAKLKGKAWRRLEERVTIPELILNVGLGETDPRLGQPMTLTRKELLGIALNTGNLSNFEKMTKGERWNPKAVMTALNRELTKEDWRLVQQMWDAVETLWPHIVATERALSGVVPEKVTASPVETPHGVFAGGYWPVVYDATRSTTAQQNEEKAADDMFGRRSGLGTPKGHTITRTEAVGPMTYSLDKVLFRHVDRVITRIAYAEYARDVMRVMGDNALSGEMALRLGAEYRDEIPLWLRDMILPVNDTKAGDFVERLLRFSRQGIVAVGMGLRIGTGVAQVSGLMSSLARLGGTQTHKLFYHVTKQALTGIASMARGERSAMHDFVFDRSPMMRERLRENSVEVERASRKLQGKHTWHDNIAAWQFWHIGMVDLHLVAIPTWMTAFRQGVDQSMTEAQAAQYADSMVATSQGSGRKEHLSRWQRSQSETKKIFFMFYTPFNVIFNAQWEAARGVKRGDFTKAANLTMFMLVAQTLMDALLSGDWPDGGDDDDTGIDDWATWAARNAFFGLFSGVPVVRDAAAYSERKISGQYAQFGGTPVSRVFEDIGRSGKRLYDIQQGEKEFAPDAVPGLANTVGALTHTPLGQPGSTIRFLWEYKRGDVEPQSIGDWYTGLTKGKMAKDRQQ